MRSLNIIIVGIGKVGHYLAEHLTGEGHNITIIDTDVDVVSQTSNTLDVIGYNGNGVTNTTLSGVGAENADLLIATTDSDEINMLCCLTAHKIGTKNTIARVRDPEYVRLGAFLKDDLGLSIIFNPELESAREIERILRFPSALEVDVFAGGRAEMVSCHLKKGSPLIGASLKEIPNILTKTRVLLAAVERDGEVIIPDGAFTLEEGDIIYFTGSPQDMTAAFKKINLSTARAKSVMIAGGGRITYYLAGLLCENGVEVHIIESDRAQAQELSRLLPKASILNGNAADHELLREEGIARMDAFVALTGLDEGNILAAIFASSKNVRKVIAKVNNESLLPLVRDTALDTVISPKKITANHILSYVRASSASEREGNMETLYMFGDCKVEAVGFRAGANGRYLNTPLKSLSLRQGTIIVCIIRGNQTIIPNGDDEIHANDTVIVVSSSQQLHNLSDILE